MELGKYLVAYWINIPEYLKNQLKLLPTRDEHSKIPSEKKQSCTESKELCWYYLPPLLVELVVELPVDKLVVGNVGCIVDV